MRHHIRRLKKHRNALYWIVFILLIFQIIIFISITSQISQLSAEQAMLRDTIEEHNEDLTERITDVRRNNQFAINQIAGQVTEQRRDIQTEIDFLKASQEDFSGIIDQVIPGVVSVITDRSAGSGFLVSSDGYIVTNYHVLQDSATITAHMFDGEAYSATVVGSNPTTDLALLKIDATGLTQLRLETEPVQIGEKVIAIGNPLGLSFTVTEGIVSATDRVGPNGLAAYVQTDVTLNPGNSGGPLINKDGSVIGINNFKIGDAESLGFALESEVIVQEINTIAQTTLIQ